jgi:tellurite resistance protein
MTDASAETDLPCRTQARWIVNAPVPLFAITMGHAGLGLAWRSAHHALGWSAVIGEALMAVAALAFLLVAGLYGLKTLLCPRAVRAEFAHPIAMNFFPAISIGLLLLAIGALPYDLQIADWLWRVGAGAHLLLAVIIMGRWIRQNTEIAHASPAWFIPVVGSIVVPIAGVPLGYPQVSWLFFAIGLAFWVPLFTIVLYRLIFHDPLPPRIAPMLFILIAPPAVGFVAYLQLNGGVLDPLAHGLLAIAGFVALILVSLAGSFLRLQFALSWWAFTFPSAALACALVKYQALAGGAVAEAVAVAAVAAATAIIALVTLRTLAALATGRVFAG